MNDSTGSHCFGNKQLASANRVQKLNAGFVHPKHMPNLQATEQACCHHLLLPHTLLSVMYVVEEQERNPSQRMTRPEHSFSMQILLKLLISFASKNKKKPTTNCTQQEKKRTVFPFLSTSVIHENKRILNKYRNFYSCFRIFNSSSLNLSFVKTPSAAGFAFFLY